ncbi:MAG: TRAP transporter small permease [Rhodospirillaceae bacterium]|nr:TRAP transporter small permease [Rhodospirillaceae bacterium]
MSSVVPPDSGPEPVRGGRVPGAEIVRLLTWISRSAIWIGGAGILFSAGLVTVEITVRKFFGMSLGGADEVSGYIFAVSTMWALPFALLNRANVRIDVVYLRLPAWLRSFLDVFSLVLLVGFVAVVFWHSVNLFVENRANDTRSITPLQARVWIWQGLWILGMALFLLTGAVLFVLAVAALVLWRHDRVAGLIGSRSSEEEIASETAFLDESGGGTGSDGRRGV